MYVFHTMDKSASKSIKALKFITWCWIGFISILSSNAEKWQTGEIVFATKVYPIIQEKCLPCHGEEPEKLKGDFDIRSKSAFLKGGETIQDLVKPIESGQKPALIEIISRTIEDLEMPPKENDKLSQKEIDAFSEWIESELPWPTEAEIQSIQNSFAKGIQVSTSHGLAESWNARRYDEKSLWAYQPLARPKIPKAYKGNPIDWFVNRELTRRKIPAAPEAKPRELLKRIHYTLSGLPPEFTSYSDLLEKESIPDTRWRTIVNHILSTHHFGEKMATHWLDAVRYADSAGLANDYMRGSAWRYRDYVIRAFNEDKPWQKFVVEQLAGDELPDSSTESLIGTGFLRMGPWELTGMEVPKVARQKYLDDVTDTVGQVFLSQPLQCAKCHDHKFDPIPTRDYYGIQAVFANTQMTEKNLPFDVHENAKPTSDKQILALRKSKLSSILNELNQKVIASQKQWCIDRGLPPMTRSEAMKKGYPEDKLPPRHAGFSVREFGLERISRKGLQRINWEDDTFQPVIHTVYNGYWPNISNYMAPKKPPVKPWQGKKESSNILIGGDPFSPGDEVGPAVLSILNTFHKNNTIPQDQSGRRLAFANWIIAPENALALRSIVNRIWAWHFNVGLVSTPNHFGTTTPHPEHLELLDYLCHFFVENKGSIKKLSELMVTSHAFRRSTHINHDSHRMDSAEAPNLFASFSPRRLNSDELRDSYLSVSDDLSDNPGGPAVRPVIDLETALQPRMVMGTFAESWQPSLKIEERNKRSIYTLKLRGIRDPFFEVFDAPNPDLSCPQRNTSTVPTQVFSLLNNENVMTRASSLAAKATQKAENLDDRIDLIYKRLFGRPPSKEESQLAEEYIGQMTAFHEQNTMDKTKYPDKVTRNAIEENTGEPFTFIEDLPAYRLMEREPHISEYPVEVRALAELNLVLMTSNEFVYIY